MNISKSMPAIKVHFQTAALFVFLIIGLQIIAVNEAIPFTMNGTALLAALNFPIILYFLFQTLYKHPAIKLTLLLAFIFLSIAILFYGLLGNINQAALILTALLYTSLVIRLALQANPQHLVNAITGVLSISIFCFLTQAAVHAFSSIFIDFHQLLFPFSRAATLASDKTFGFTRYSSIFMEPGIYSTVTLILVFLRTNLTPKPSWLDWVAIGTIPLTFSYSGLVFFMLGAFYLLQRERVNTKLLLRILIATACTLVVAKYLGVDEYLASRMANLGADRSANIKVTNISTWNSLSLERKLIGGGIGAEDCEGCAFINSSGFWFSTIFQLGLLGALIDIALVALVLKHPGGMAMAIALMISRFRLYDIAPILLISVLIYKNKLNSRMS